MTPEARAENAIKDWNYQDDSPPIVETIAAAIRAAENDALERAAKVLDNGSFLHTGAPSAGWARQVSALIRDLKHETV